MNKFISCLDKRFCHHSYYNDTARVMEINLNELSHEKFKIKNIEICEEIDGVIFKIKYNSIKDVMEYFEHLLEGYDKETFIFYVKDISKTHLIFDKYIEEVLSDKVLYLLPHKDGKHYGIEIRSLTGFKKDLDNYSIEELQKFMQYIYDTIFIPNHYFYLTVYQKLRKNMEKEYKNSKIEVKSVIDQSKPIWPMYQELKKAKRGGLCFCHYPYTEIKDPVIGVDRTSAYPCDILFEKYPMSRWVFLDPNTWKNYIDDDKYCSLGTYEINYDSNFDHYLSNVYAAETERMLPRGINQTVELTLTNIDIKLLKLILDIREIKCKKLFICKADYLPDYVCNLIIEMYKRKKQAKEDHVEKYIYDQIKLELNSVTGNLQRGADTFEEFKTLQECINPSWGVWLTAYSRLHLIELAVELDDKFYGDTDSIFCDDNVKNRNKIATANLELLNKIRFICKKRNWDIDLLGGIGKFDIEHEIKSFCANRTKQYGYICNDGEEIVKASGYKKNSITYEQLRTKKMPPMEIELYYKIDDDIFSTTLSREEYLLMKEQSKKGY